MVLYASRAAIAGTALGYALLAVIAIVAPLWVAWQGTQQEARRTAEQVSGVIAAHVGRTITATDMVLADLAAQVRGADGQVATALPMPHLHAAALTLPTPGSLWATDARGTLVSQSVAIDARGQNFADREYFVPHSSGARDVYVSRIVAGRITHRYHWLISRALHDGDGRFAGVVLAALDADAFADLFRALDLGPASTIAVRRGDGALLLREPLVEPLEDEGVEMLHPPPRHGLLGLVTGPDLRLGADGVLRGYAARAVPGHDAVVYVGVALRDLAQTVWRQALPFVFAVVGVSLPMVVLFGWAYRAARGDARQRVALIARTDALEASVRDAARDAEIQAERLRQSNADLERFAYAVSHDLQEPLRMVSSFLGLLDRHSHDHLDGADREYIGFAVGGANRMRGMIQGLLDWSRVETQGHPPAPVDSADALSLALSNLRVAIEGAGARVEVGALPRVLADRDQLARLFQNLVGNALKYAAPQRPPVVRIAAEAAEGFWRFTVTDNGLGIPEDQRERVFDVFYRLHTHDAIPGTGVGLSLCKRIVERHGGTIRLGPGPDGVGTRVAFTLPVAPPVPPAAIGDP